MYGFDVLKKEPGRVEAARLLLSKIQLPAAPDEQNPTLNLNGNRFERRLRNKLTQASVADENKTPMITVVENWIREFPSQK